MTKVETERNDNDNEKTRSNSNHWNATINRYKCQVSFNHNIPACMPWRNGAPDKTAALLWFFSEMSQ